MANELTLSLNGTLLKGEIYFSWPFGDMQFDVAGDKVSDVIQEIGTSEEALTLGESAVGGYMILKNLDATNFIEIRPNTGVADLIKLLPGDVALFRTTGDSAPYGIADTAACDLRIVTIQV